VRRYQYEQYKEGYRKILGEYDYAIDNWITGLGRRSDWTWYSGFLDQNFVEETCQSNLRNELSMDLGKPAVVALRALFDKSIPEPNPYATISSEPWTRDIDRARDYLSETCRSAPILWNREQLEASESDTWETISNPSSSDFEKNNSHYQSSIWSPVHSISWDAGDIIHPKSSASQVRHDETHRSDDIVESEREPVFNPATDVTRITSTPMFTYTAPFPPPRLRLRRSPSTAPYSELLTQVSNDALALQSTPRVRIRRRNPQTLLNASARILPGKKRWDLEDLWQAERMLLWKPRLVEDF
jgi:hypothetical protein